MKNEKEVVVEGPSPQKTTIKHHWKNLNIRFVFDVNGEALGFKNLSVVSLNLIWVTLVIVLFVGCGTLNTIFYNEQNESYSKGFGSSPPRLYAHPFSQAIQMFLGMIFFCLPIHFIKEKMEQCGLIDRMFKKKKKKENTVVAVETKKINAVDEDYDEHPPFSEDEQTNEEEVKPRPINQLLFLIPATCNLFASSIMYYGLLLTYASVYQMLMSTVVVFTAILSVIFLKSDIWKYPHHWIGVILIVVGNVIVGYSSITQDGQGKAAVTNPTLGALMVTLAQLVYAVQYCFEETFLKGYDTDPLQVPGYEGYWGFSIEMMILFIMYYIPGNDYGSLENFAAGIMQAFSNPLLLLWIILLILNIGLYNFVKNWITKEISASAQTTLDCVRNVLVWFIQIEQGYQEFAWLQLIGFLILVLGTLVYFQIGFNIFFPYACCKERVKVWRKKCCGCC